MSFKEVGVTKLGQLKSGDEVVFKLFKNPMIYGENGCVYKFDVYDNYYGYRFSFIVNGKRSVFYFPNMEMMEWMRVKVKHIEDTRSKLERSMCEMLLG